ncbi:MAG: AAA family ATPase, partial [Solirubrobacteraceae bacterium]
MDERQRRATLSRPGRVCKVICANCGGEVPDGAKFCIECGAAHELRCPTCATPHAPGQKFCAGCGTPLAESVSAEPTVTELRLVSVLFVDIVSYTTLSESRDAEDVRELLARYFDVARTIIGRHGGTLEKFIGDAVMAVWGAPVAREDDAERAVRAALELVEAVSAMGEEVGIPELRARGGIVTGQAASVNRPGEGLVVGDRVNTAARTQSAAEPGAVFVDGVTREATSLAIAYEDAGEHTVKGKSEPLRLWRAVRVVAGVRGAGRERGLEPPLVGREADLRLLKDLFHGTIERGAARLVAISGEAGVGKSRLLWEFDKYVDGLAETVLWHRGACLSYGEGIAYWALAEMVRQRLGIAQDAPVETIARRLQEALERWVPETADREFLEPRLGVLLGLAEGGMPRAELYAGWRMFLERLAGDAPVVLVFEDLQWADEGLLAFIEHVLDWAQSSPIFILTLARHEIPARPEGWPPARRGATLVQLDGLSAEAMGELLDGLVDGLQRSVRRQVIERAEGLPLYALETLRVLVSRGALREQEGRLVADGELGELDVPATLGSLIAARLDALAPLERHLVRTMCVFGGSFPRAAAAELGDVPERELDEVLAALVRKQVLSISADPFSPQRGQYSFCQQLLRTVAYERLARRERKPRHTAAAEYLRRTFPGDGEEVAEVVASHYLDAYRAAREDEDAPALRGEAITALRRLHLRQHRFRSLA